MLSNSKKFTITVFCNLYKILVIVIELGFHAIRQYFGYRIPAVLEASDHIYLRNIVAALFDTVFD